MGRDRRFRATLLLGFLLGAAFLYLVLSHVDARAALRQIRQVRFESLALVLLLTLGNFLTRGWRWQKLFPSAVAPPFCTCYHINMISLLANNALPGRGGDILRCVLLGRSVPAIGSTMAAATLGVEKLFDGLALLGVVLFSFLFWTPPEWVGRLTWIAGAVFFGVIILLFTFLRRHEVFAHVGKALFSRLGMPGLGERAGDMCLRFAQGLDSVTTPAGLARIFAFTAVIWMLDAAVVALLAHAAGVSLSLMQSALVSAIIGLGLMIPAAPGYVGTYEFFAVSVLGLLGVPGDKGLAVALLLHAWTLLTTTLVGMVSVSASGNSFFRLLNWRSRNEIDYEPDTRSQRL